MQNPMTCPEDRSLGLTERGFTTARPGVAIGIDALTPEGLANFFGYSPSSGGAEGVPSAGVASG